MAFITDNMYGYEDNIFRKMNRIDNFFGREASSTITLEVESSFLLSSNSQSFSLYGRKMEKTTRLAESLYRDTDNEIRRVAERIKVFSNNPKYMKYEMEATNAKHNLMNMKLNIIKTIADMDSKVKKASDDDIKLQKELGREVANPGMSTGISNADNYLNNVLSMGADSFTPTYDSFSVHPSPAPSRVEELEPPTPVDNSIIINTKEKEHL